MRERSPSISTIHSHTGVVQYHPTYRQTLSDMSSLPSGNGRSNLAHDPCQYGISNTHTDSKTSNSIRGHSNQNIGNVLNSYNTIIVGASDESLRIHIVNHRRSPTTTPTPRVLVINCEEEEDARSSWRIRYRV